ncbi:hypothetical protein SAMD00019534_022180 [Acytostelium subglobosum LB1]|uniref:hypothetical protein n=1 Tax=Acytostelium subglobosum LB1 TaxID=1410327 RepID=UPI00064494A1|nr:hypothetical protein SAMD00019534_022180 [Acytostelium subglobosum LB1]GAM19043.1 hypothetical protein SAMD00019534_022180 [Acytostelium subglobosum LB1]|eukprot:XP_012756970.1 hypothetical protein SAMD00019534_022180 [Acytostelium subglobosum LB1]
MESETGGANKRKKKKKHQIQQQQQAKKSNLPLPLPSPQTHTQPQPIQQQQEKEKEKEKIIEYDVNGREICFLFRKFQKCRYGVKCKRSHLLNSPDTPSTVLSTTTTSASPAGGVVNIANTNKTAHSVVQKLMSLFNQPKLTATPTPTQQQRPQQLELTMIEQCRAKMMRSTGKLVLTSTTHKVPKTLAKEIKRHHWRVKTTIDTLLAGTPPFIYRKSLTTSQRLKDINYSRMRPLIYIMLKPILSLDVEEWWLQMVGDTLLSMLCRIHMDPVRIEQRLVQWGVGTINARKLVVMLWSVMAQSTQSKHRISSLVQTCEREVRSGDMRAIDYARACQFSANQTKLAYDVTSKLTNESSESIKLSQSQTTSQSQSQTLANIHNQSHVGGNVVISLTELKRINNVVSSSLSSDQQQQQQQWKERKRRELEMISSIISSSSSSSQHPPTSGNG